MSASLSPLPKLQFFDANGNPLVGGRLYTFAAGTTTPLDTYTDATGTIAASNPIVLNGRGECEVWLGGAPYKFRLETSAGVEVWTVDNVTQANADQLQYTPAATSLLNGVVTTVSGALNELSHQSTGSTRVGFLQAGAGAVQRTVQSKLREVVALSVTDFGAVGDSNIETGGGTNDTAAINLAIAACLASNATLTAPPGKCFRITSALDMRGIEEIDFRGQIYVDNVIGGPAVVIGGFSNGGSRKKFYFNEIHDGGSRIAAPANPLLRVFGLKGSFIEVPACRYVEIYADNAVSGGGSNAYNLFLFGQVYKLQLKGADAASWINENEFRGGRHSVLNIGTTTTENLHNHNVWTFPVFEGQIQINIQAGFINWIKNCRFEGVDVAGSAITFSAVSFQNYILSDYDTAPFGGQLPTNIINPIYVSDAGANNILGRTSDTLYNKVDLFTLDARTQMLIDGTLGDAGSRTTTNQRGLFDRNKTPWFSEAVGMVPGLDYIKFTYSFRDIYQSEMIPASVGDAYGITFETTTDAIRYSIEVFDANYAPLGAEGVGGPYIAGSSLTYSGTGRYTVTGNLAPTNTAASGAYGIGVRRSEVKYVRITLATGNVAALLRAARVFLMAKPNGAAQTRQVAAASKDIITMNLPSVPTGGYVGKGTMVSDDDGSSIYICTFNYETTLNGALAGGATSVTVTAAGSIANSDVVGILLNDGSTHWSAVSALAGATFTVAALPSAAASGNKVVFNRWATK